MHMSYGGGLSGYLAFHNDPAVIESCPAFIFAKTETLEPGQNGFGYLNFDRTHYVKRGEGSQNGGTTTALWAITAAAYLGLLGPQGLRELGEGLMQRSRYAAERLGAIPGVTAPRFSGPILKEFVLTYDNHEVAAVDDALRARGIFGGKDLSVDFPELGRSSLWAVTEVHTKEDIDRLVEALTEVLA
jgi:glycine dehydrogenase subunit 1